MHCPHSFVGNPQPLGRGNKKHKKQSPVSRALNTTANSVVRFQRALAECRAHAVLFGEANHPNHLIFLKT